MTCKDAIKTIKTAIAEVEWNYPMDYAVAFEKAIDALKNEDRFRWHDLRKDPNDLPTDNMTVLVCIVHDYCDDDGWFSYDFGWFIESWFTNYHCRGIESKGYKVIAWREIEPFDGVK